ncbi:hypothetical protein [Geothermobacter hydrogeniphilus]|uniref:PilZ domain-containing protein n=1 Tax=Geothermobacter hydrogeniphilus TaxID=1969733 RepID=A0A1X0YEB6_9BACT|nr:hypothetical protein [Geothermobacter hydrogeniphilus]ORJ63324.1 hypothetical protein B5V00_00195 [Geothermobacter hydrogeniphilus]
MTMVAASENVSRQENTRPVSQRQLADRVNRLNFLEELILVQFSHLKYGQMVTVTAAPLPCDGTALEAGWRSELPENCSQYVISGIILPGTPRAFAFAVEDARITADGLVCQLPKKGQALPKRQYSRMRPLAGIKATLFQHGICFQGVLTDFSAHALCVEVGFDTPNSRYWIMPDQVVHLSLQSDKGVIYSGEMMVIRSENGADTLLFVLAPVNTNTPRFPTKKYRGHRACLLPEPSLAFRHPLTGRYLELNVADLSGLGVCVEEAPERSMLIAGMILPEMCIKLGAGFEIPCRGQVVYRNESDDGAGGARCGLTLLDIEIQDHLLLLSLLQRARNRHSYLNPSVDIESLWEFFFETGFIYPSKYLLLAKRKAGFQETFRKTYLEQTPIARHFTFQVEGQIEAHLSAIRLYEQTWFQQHHAARRSGKHAIGFEVIQQLAEYFYNACFLSRDKIGYVAGVYRPENRFPRKYYRAIVSQLKNKKAASLDAFAYFKTIPEIEDQWAWAKVPPDWHVARTTRGDLDELAGFYEQISGGCMIDALDLQPKMIGRTVLEKEYRNLGMIRRRHLYSIKRGRELMAVVELHQSDTGLSLSRMDRVIFCFVLGEDLPPGLLTTLVRGFADKLGLDHPPMMVYPRDYADRHELEVDKTYEMMILNVYHGEEYMQFLDDFIAAHSSVR